MADQARPSSAKKSSSATPMQKLVMTASAALLDPKVRQVFFDLSGKLVGGVSDWQDNRQETKHSRPDRVRAVNRFGHAGLALRAERMANLVQALRTNPVLPRQASDALGEFQKALDLINLRLQVAAALPLTKRLGLHREINQALDSLEELVATVGRPEPSSSQPPADG